MVDGGDSPPPAPEPPGLATGVSLSEAPILLLVHFHKALKEELEEIRRVIVGALETGIYGKDLVLEVHRRFEFLKLAYKYHCAAEDEVIFSALDAHTKNVASTYSLEHRSIDGLFESIFQCFNVLSENDASFDKPFQELESCIGTLHMAICKHMMKEEKQVFPLLMQLFSSKEQASLVWQFICCVPINLLEDILPWMNSFLSPDEQLDVLSCMKGIIPNEEILQEVVLSWLGNKRRPFGVYAYNGEAAQCPDGPQNPRNILEEHPVKSFSGVLKKADFLHTDFRCNPIESLLVWHAAISKDLREIFKDLCQMRLSSDYSDLASVIVQLKFLADVLTFYCNGLDKIFYPMLKEAANSSLPLSCGSFLNESSVEGLQRSLYYNAKNGIPASIFVEKLSREVESFIKGITKQFAFQQREVFPIITKNCNHEMQQHLLYMSLNMMPLGLLKCAITWFSAHLSEVQSMCILHSIRQVCPLVNKSFASLLLEWVRIGCSGKTSVEKFRKDLQKMFETKCFSLSDQIKQDKGSSTEQLDPKPCNNSSPESIPVDKVKNFVSTSSCGSTIDLYATSYSSGVNMHIFFPGSLEIPCPFPKFSGVETSAESIHNEPRPLDYIFLFHKALKKDLEYLVVGSAQLAESIELLVDFCRRFRLLQFLYQIHSDAEDEIAFPALEAKGNKGQNISFSYSIDHKIEADHLKDVSSILDEICEVHVLISGVDVDKLDQKVLKYRQLCMKLHDMCKSMHKILCDHIHHEEVELWPLFRECFSIEEQEKIIGYMLGRTTAEILQEMIPWLMAYLTPEEQQVMMSLWRKATKNTMFNEWLQEWWVDMKKHGIIVTSVDPNIFSSSTIDPLELISTYLSKEGPIDQGGGLCDKDAKYAAKNCTDADIERSGTITADDKGKVTEGDEHTYQCSECSKLFSSDTKKRNKEACITWQLAKPGQHLQVSQKFRHQDKLLSMSQEDLEAAIRRISRDSSLDPQKKSYIIQNLMMSRWIVTNQKTYSEATVLNEDEIPGQGPSYRDPLNGTFGCEHYKRNCKLLAACCNQLYACRYCHDEVADHSMDRKAATKMMCMKCLIIQSISPTCSTASCNNLRMAKYYCKICKLFDDERDIYHCPYCNLCRVGKGLGIDYFHCMNCNACMSPSLSVHVCREKSFEDNCPICHEYIFTSSSPVKALPCGHVMHSACFKDYTCTHYTCPICSKSLGDMQVYFGMLDVMLAEEKMPDEYSDRTQVILCNDCEKRGPAPYHWLYHKCQLCGSYNTRIL